MRKLASIKQIGSITPIEGKDRIVLATVDGWQVIVRKDEYKVGDWTIFCEPDSVLPALPQYEFLKSKKYRIKTMKMGGVLSQGICFPLSVLPEATYELDLDVTELMGITKYEPHPEKGPKTKRERVERPWYYKLLAKSRLTRWMLNKKDQKCWPEFIQKTDEDRIQNCPIFLQDKDTKYIVTEKVEGQSGTFALKRTRGWFRDKFEFIVCSRNVRKFTDDGMSFWKIAKKFDIERVLYEILDGHDYVILQGECVGPDIQGNIYKLNDYHFYAFNLIYPDRKVKSTEAIPILKKANPELDWCPHVDLEYTLPDTVNELLDYATGPSVIHPTMREGLVFRNYEKNISFKAVSPDYLIERGY